MNVKQAYNNWAAQYDENENKTRDLEAIALKENLDAFSFDSCLEIGCGTGKNTTWLATKANKILAIDFSDEMLAKAKAKIHSPHVTFLQADISQPWNFITSPFDLVTFSLVLEHIENLDSVFQQTAAAVKTNGYVYVGELHPFKQYSGSKARFETEEGVQIVTCFNHHVSDFTNAAKKHGFALVHINEYFDNTNQTMPPRILTLLFRKQ